MSHPDRHALYQLSAQNPEADLAFLDRVFEEHANRKPMTLREDFCGSAYLSCCFAASDPERQAIGVDPDEEPLQWCRANNLGPGRASLAQRVRLARADVVDGPADRTDVVAALNFGLFLLRTRTQLLRYFEASRGRLGTDGLFVGEIVGGEESIKPLLERRDEDGFTYVWEQEAFNPIDSRMRAHVHFEFPGGGQLFRAFSYDWRVWTMVELREVLAQAGFSKSTVYWEQTGEDGYGTGEYRPTEEEEQQESWLAYLVAVP